MSLQECQIARSSPNQLEMTTNSPALALEQCQIPDHTGRLCWLPLGNSRDFLRHPSQVYRNTNFSLGTQGKLHELYMVSRRADSQDSIKEVNHIATIPQEETSLSNRYMRGTLNWLCHVQWIPRFPESTESQISLQWLECRLVFQLSIQRDVLMFCAVPRENPMSHLIWTGGLTSFDTSRGPRSSVFRNRLRPDSS